MWLKRNIPYDYRHESFQVVSILYFVVFININLFFRSGFNFDKIHPEKVQIIPTLPISIENGNTSHGEEKQIKQEDEKKEEETPTTPPQSLKVEQISIGVEYSVLLTQEGDAYLFDINTCQLNAKINAPGDKQVAISAGQEHILLLSDDGRVQSWGRGLRGQLGHGTLDNVDQGQAKTIEALEGMPFKAISAGGWHSIALSLDSSCIYAWGWNSHGQLGVPRSKVQVTATPLLVEVSEDDCFELISCGSRHSMVVNQNGIAFGFGWNQYGQLGLDPKTIKCQDTPAVIPVDERVVNIVCKFWASLIETEKD